jgi:putative endonuclease
MPYYCYIVECADGTFYTGWSKDPQRREGQHNRGTGARYTRQHRPVKLVYVEEQPDISSALRRERKIKSLSRSQKMILIEKRS